MPYLLVGRIVPDDPDHVAGAERHLDDVARFDRHGGRHSVAVRRGDGDGDEHGDGSSVRRHANLRRDDERAADDGLPFR